MEQLRPLVESYGANPFVRAILVVALVNLVVLAGVLLYAGLQRLLTLRVQRNLRHVHDDDAPVDELLADLLRGVPRWAWVAAYVRQLVEARRRGDAQCDLAALSDHVANRAHLPLSLVRQTAGVLVLLGLCGAVYGLLHVFQDLAVPLREIQTVLADTSAGPPGKAYSVKDDPAMKAFQGLAQTLERSLDSTRGAFGASITGILSTVVLVLVGWLVGLLLDMVLLHLERIATERLMPLLILPSQDASMAEAARSFADSTSYLSTLSDSLTDQSTHVSEYMSSMYAFVEQFHDAARSLGSGHERLETSQQSLVGLIERFVSVSEEIQNAQAHNQRALDELGGLMKTTLDRLERQAEAESRMRTRADEGLQKTIHLVRDLFEQNFVQLGERVGETVQCQLAEHRSLLADIEARQAAWFESLNDAVRNGTGHQALLDGVRMVVEQQHAAFDDQLGRFVTAQQGWVQAALAEGVKAQASTLDVLRALMERQGAAMEEQMRALRAMRDEEQMRASTERTRLSETLARLGSAVGGRGISAEAGASRMPTSVLMAMAAIVVPTVTVACLTYINSHLGAEAMPVWGGGLLACVLGTGGFMRARGWLQ